MVSNKIWKFTNHIKQDNCVLLGYYAACSGNSGELDASVFMVYEVEIFLSQKNRVSISAAERNSNRALWVTNTTNISMRCFTYYGKTRPLVFEWKDGLRMWFTAAD